MMTPARKAPNRVDSDGFSQQGRAQNEKEHSGDDCFGRDAILQGLDSQPTRQSGAHEPPHEGYEDQHQNEAE
jgi:hypothetical protein